MHRFSSDGYYLFIALIIFFSPFFEVIRAVSAVNSQIVGGAKQSSDKKVGGVAEAEPFKKQQILVENARLFIFDRDAGQPTGLDTKSLAFGQKLAASQLVDTQKRVKLTFNLKRADATAFAVHQAFVLLVHQPSKREIIYVADMDKTNALYTFDLDMKTHEKDFSGVGGLYAAHLLLGDFSAENTVDWHFADFDLQIPMAPFIGDDASSLPKSTRLNYDKLPEINHQFRVAEPRPPTIVSDAFAAACAAPLLILFILWCRIGLNCGNIQLSLWMLGFHFGLCSIFGLYTCYWLRLDMFETLKWLALIGAPTFFFGNRLFRGVANRRKNKTKE